MLSWKCFEIVTPKTLENIQKNVLSGVLIPDSIFLCKYFSVKESEVLRSAKKRKEILRFWKNRPNKSVFCFLWVFSGNSLNEGILLKCSSRITIEILQASKNEHAIQNFQENFFGG